MPISKPHWDIVTRQHGGTIEVDSQVGDFTEITIRLPPRASGRPGVTAILLVVDDKSHVAELYRQRFRREVRQGTYAMHDTNLGEDALGEIKGRYPELPVMMVSAYGDDETRRRAKELAAAEFLTSGATLTLVITECR